MLTTVPLADGKMLRLRTITLLIAHFSSLFHFPFSLYANIHGKPANCVSNTGNLGNRRRKKLSTGDLKKKYVTIARNKFIRTPPVVVLNRDTSWQIELSRRVISEWRIKSRTRERIVSIQLLDLMLEGAEFIKTIKDTKNTPGIDSVSYFENKCKINGKLFRINITVKSQKKLNRKYVYYYSAKEF